MVLLIVLVITLIFVVLIVGIVGVRRIDDLLLVVHIIGFLLLVVALVVHMIRVVLHMISVFLFVEVFQIDLLLPMLLYLFSFLIVCYYCHGRPLLNNFLRRLYFNVWFHSTISAPDKLARFIIKDIILILREHTPWSVINDVITCTLDICEILVNLLLRQLLRVPLDKIRVVEVLMFAFVMD
jgi:hypothetical protein